MSEQPVSWTVLQIAEAIRSADALLRPGLLALNAITDEMGDDEEIVLAADDGEMLRATAEELADLAGQLESLTDRLPAGEIHVDYPDLSDGAEAELAHGIIDLDRALLAICLLPVQVGWNALAHALLTSDTHTGWREIPVAGLLASFRGADDDAVQRVLVAAQIPSSSTLAACDEDQIARLAAALQAHAPADDR